MRSPASCLFALALAGAAAAQQWELGAAGGVGITKDLTVTRGSQSASAGFKTGPAFSAFAGHNLYEHLGGEFRYTFQFSDLKLSSGATETTFEAQSHAVHYDLLLLGGSREAALRPYVGGGGGIRVYRGTGKEHATQPLSNFAILSKTQQVEGLLTAAGGVKLRLGRHGLVRAEVRGYFTPVPKNVIAPVPGAKLSGWVMEVVPMVGLGFSF